MVEKLETLLGEFSTFRKPKLRAIFHKPITTELLAHCRLLFALVLLAE